jgi:hypothetical protein
VFRIPEKWRDRAHFAQQLRRKNKLSQVESLFQSGTFRLNVTAADRLPPDILANAIKSALDVPRTFLATAAIVQAKSP